MSDFSRSPGPPVPRSGNVADKQEEVRLRDIRREDFEAMYRLDQVCFEPGIAYSRDELRRFLSMASFDGVAAESEGRLVGFAIGYLSRGKVAHVVTLDVDPGHRRQGLGRELLGNLLERFAGRGAGRARLEVSTENRGAIAFYEKLGFALLGTIRDYYSAGAHAFEMEKPLG